MGAELDFLIWIQDNLRSSLADTVMVSVSAIANYGIIFALVGLILLLSKRYRWIGVALLIGWLGAELIDTAVKYVVCRPRPFMDYPVELLVSAPVSPSFPSTHTAAAVMAVTVMHMFGKHRAAVSFAVIAILIMISRMYLFVHYPTDIIGGAVFGIACGYLAYVIATRIGRDREGRYPDDLPRSV